MAIQIAQGFEAPREPGPAASTLQVHVLGERNMRAFETVSRLLVLVGVLGLAGAAWAATDGSSSDETTTAEPAAEPATPKLEGATAADPWPPLTPFQWTLVNGATLILVPVDGVLYPARRADDTTIETHPPRIPVVLYHDDRELTPALHDLVAPYAVDNGGWIMERHLDGRWVPVQSFLFHEQWFYGQDTPGQLDLTPNKAIRFRAR